jgi:UDP-N-acetylglucosamine:LPS N-acetylglucosamine transferase
VFEAWQHLGHVRPDIVVSPGTGVAVGYFVAARLRRIPAMWIETFNMVDRPGIAARVCSRLAGAVVIQRPELLATRRNAVLVGELY